MVGYYISEPIQYHNDISFVFLCIFGDCLLAALEAIYLYKSLVPTFRDTFVYVLCNRYSC